MKRVIKIVGLLIAFALAALLLLAVAIRIFLPPEKAKAMILAQVGERLHREAKLGEVSVGLFSGLRVTGFSLSERPTFGAGTFVASDALRVRVALPPLLARRIVVTDVRLENPSVHIVRTADGKFNFSDLSGSTEPSAPAPAGKSGNTPPVVVTGLSVTGGKLTFEDHLPGGRSVTLDPLNVSLRNLSLAGSADVDATLGVKTDGMAADLAFAGVVNVPKSSVTIRKCRLSSGESAISIDGKASGLTTDPAFDLNVALERLSLPLVAKFMPDVAAYRLSGAATGRLKANGRQSDLSFDASLDLGAAGFSIPDALVKTKDTPMTVAAAGRLQNLENLKLDRLALGLGGLQATASGTVRGVQSSTRTFDLALKTNAFPVKDLFARLPAGTLPADVALDGNAALGAKVTGRADDAAVDFDLDATAAGVAYATSFRKPAGVPLTAKGSGRYTAPTAVNLRALTLDLAGMKLAGPADYRSGPKGGWSAKLKGGAFALAPVAALAPAAAPYAAAGTMTLDVDAKSGAAAPEVKGSFTLKDGAARYEASTLTDMVTAGDFTMDSVSLPSFKAKLNGADLAMKLNAKNVQKHPDVEIDLNAAELDLDKLVAPTDAPKKTDARPSLFVAVADAAAEAPVPPMDVAGTVKVARLKHAYFTGNDLNVTFNLTGVTPELNHVGGTAKLRHGKGEFRNLQKLTADSRFARILFAPVKAVQKLAKASGGAFKIPSMDQIPFSSISGDYAFRDGVMSISSFLLKASEFDTTMTGTVQLFGEQVLDTKGVLTVSGIGAPFTVKGPVATATPKIDYAGTATNVLKSGALDSTLKKYGLPGFGKPKNEEPAPAPGGSAPADQAAPATPAAPVDEKAEQKKQLEDAGRELLRGLFKKH